MYESDFLEHDNYHPDFNRSPLSTHSVPQSSPYLANAEDFLSVNLFGSSSPAFFVQPPTRSNTVLSPPLDTFEALRYQYRKGYSPESSVGDDYLVDEPNDLLFGHRSRTHSRASSISSSHTQGLSVSQFTGASTSPNLLPGDAPELSPHLTDLGNLQIGIRAWVQHGLAIQQASESPTLVIPTDPPIPPNIDPNASLFEASQPPGLVPPPSLGLIPATPVTPPPINRSWVSRKSFVNRWHRGARPVSHSILSTPPLLSGSQTPEGSGSQANTPPSVPADNQAPWSAIINQSQPPMPPMPPMASLSDSTIFPQISGARPAIGRSHPVLRTLAPQLSLGMPSVNPSNILGNRVPDLNVGVGGSLWDNAIDPMLNLANHHRARSVGDANGNRRGHMRNARSEDVSAILRTPDMGSHLYLGSDGSLAPPSMSVPSNGPADHDEGGVGPKRRGHERTGSGTHRVSPYHTPNSGPRNLPGEDGISYGGITLTKPVERVHVTTPLHERLAPTDARPRPTSSARFLDAVARLRAISIFEVSGRKQVSGSGGTSILTNSIGHIRSHNEERPFKCKWPGCDKGFARQHDCKRHEALHLNIRPYTCEGCQKTFARMDALNRHLRSEGGTECQRVQSEITEAPTDNMPPNDWQKNTAGGVVV
ncbi:Zinc finger, C2H2 type [Rhizoctonia solani]|uniref:Zinc finger, C2H2 type n=1 Tax=Rhizoctonia solani TaxID=456999 RepID=A0A8H7M4D8_9AGAM|nr:Zinc finger, C2H2 type [Rhizoctonia solani]